jgi:hypothetical protein
MNFNPLANLGQDERKLLAVFAQYGHNGRAITTASLAAHAGLVDDSRRLSLALKRLATRGFIKEAGSDALISSPPAYSSCAHLFCG